MELRHLRTFLALSEELHFGRTARRLHVAQSAVSQTIRALEEEIGAELFARTPRRVTLTPAGTELVAFSQRALAEIDRGTTSARRAASGEQGRLHLCFGPMTALTSVPALVARFEKELSRVRIELENLSGEEQLASLRDGRADLGFLPMGKYDFGDLSHMLVAQTPVTAVLRTRHRLSTKASVTFQELSGERLLIGPTPCTTERFSSDDFRNTPSSQPT